MSHQTEAFCAAEPLVRNAGQKPEQEAVRFLTDGEKQAAALTYGQLLRRASGIARSLVERGANGERVIVAHPPGLEFIASMYACWLAGAVAVPSFPPGVSRKRSGSRLGLIVADARPKLALTTKKGLDNVVLVAAREPGLEMLQWVATDILEEADGPPVVDMPELALLQYTSGSTGIPKGVMLTHENLNSNVRAIQKAVALQPEEWRGVAWLPPYHDMGLIGAILSSVAAGGHVVLMDPAHFMEKPMRWLRATSAHRATVTVGPNFAYDLCVRTTTPEQRSELDLSSLRVVLNGAEPVRAATLQRFAEAFTAAGFRRESFVPCYGLAEATLAVTAGRWVKAAEGLVSCGAPIEPTRVSLDPETSEILVEGPGVSPGYWNRPEETARVFRDGVLRTGDVGALIDGELYVKGRIKELIKVRGRNYYPQDLEEAAERAHPAIAQNSTAAFAMERNGEEVFGLVCEIRREMRHGLPAEEVMEAVARAVATDAGIAPAAVALVNPLAIPRTSSGKLGRRSVGELFESGELKCLASSLDRQPPRQEAGTSGSTTERVRKLVAALRQVDPVWIDESRPLATLGVDSLLRMELLLALEAEFGLSLSAGTVDEVLSIAELAALVEQQQRSAVQGHDPGNGEFEGEAPLSPLQHAYLEMEPAEPAQLGTVVYLRTPKFGSAELLQQAVALAELEFDALRLRFHKRDGQWRQTYVPAGRAVRLTVTELRQASAEVVREHRERVERELPAALNAECGPLIAAEFFDRGAVDPGILILCVQHLVADGLSVALFAVAVDRNYRALAEGRETGKPRLATPGFGQWCRQMQARAETPEVVAELARWEAVCGPAGNTPKPEDKLRPTQSRFLETAALRALEQKCPVAQEQHDLFLAAFWSAWVEATGERELLVMLENHGRGALPDCRPTKAMGWFVCHYPVRLQGEAGAREVRRAVAAVPAEGAGYGMLRYLNRNGEVKRRMSALAAPRVAFRFPRFLHKGGRLSQLQFLREYGIDRNGFASRDQEMVCTVHQTGDTTAWQIWHRERVGWELAERVAEGMGRFLLRELRS